MSRDWKSRSSFMASFWPLYAAEWMAVNPRCVCVCVYVGGGGGGGGGGESYMYYWFSDIQHNYI